MDEPAWVKAEVARAIHKRQLAEHGGIDGVRDEGMLSSALARPRQLLCYSHEPPDLAALAAAYAFGIAKNHPFLDGNKRTAAVVCEAFIEMNGHELAASDEATYLAFANLAAGKMSEEEFTHWIRDSLRVVP